MPPIPRPVLERLIARSERVTKARQKSLGELRDRLGKRAPLRGRKPKDVTAEEYAKALAECYDREGEVREVLFLDAAWHFKTDEPWFAERTTREDLAEALSEANHPDHALGLAWTALARVTAEDPDWSAFVEACLDREAALDAELSDEGKEADSARATLAGLAAARDWKRLFEEAAPRAEKFPANPLFRRYEALALAGLGRAREGVDALWPDLESESIDGGAEGARAVAAGLLLSGLAMAETGEAFTRDGSDLRVEALASDLARVREDARLAALAGPRATPVAAAAPPPPPPILWDELDEAIRAGGGPNVWARVISDEIHAPVALFWDGHTHGTPEAQGLLSEKREFRGPKGCVRRLGEDAFLAATGALDDRAAEGFRRAAARLEMLRVGSGQTRRNEEAFAAARRSLLDRAEEPPARISEVATSLRAGLPSATAAAHPSRVEELDRLAATLERLSGRVHAAPDPRRVPRAARAYLDPVRARRRAFALARSAAPDAARATLEGLSEGDDETARRARELMFARAETSPERARRFVSFASGVPAPILSRREAGRALRLVSTARRIAPEEIRPEEAKEVRRNVARLLRELGRACGEGLLELDEDPLREAAAALARDEDWEGLRRLVERATRGRIPEDPTLSVAYASALAQLGDGAQAETFLARVLESSDRAEWRVILGLLETSAVEVDARARLAARFDPPAPPAAKPLAGKKIGFLSNFDNWKPYVDRIVRELGGEVVWLGGVRNHWKDYVPYLQSCDAVVRFIRTMYHHDPGFDKAVDAAGAKAKTWTHTRGVSALRGFLTERARSAGWR